MEKSSINFAEKREDRPLTGMRVDKKGRKREKCGLTGCGIRREGHCILDAESEGAGSRACREDPV